MYRLPILYRPRNGVLLLWVAASLHAAAQSSPAAKAVLDKLDAQITFAGVHDSYLGWYTVTTPAVLYTFSPHFSADASVAIYPSRNAPDSTANTNNYLRATHGDVGDTFLAGHANYMWRSLWNTSTASLSLPTGNRPHGLGSGRVTFDLSQHMERYFGRNGLLLDVGGGNASGLVNSLVTEDFDSLGPLAHFQTGFVVWMKRNAYFQATAYEQLPLGDQKTYETLSGPGQPSFVVVTGRRVSEDNGFSATFAVPLSTHVQFASTYSRSLRFSLDTVSTGVTFRWKGWNHSDSLVDAALREAESGMRIPYPEEKK